MKKQAKGIVALSAILVAMLGGSFAYMKLNPEKTEDKADTPELLATVENSESMVIIDDNGQKGIVSKAVIKNSSGEMYLTLKAEPTDDGSAALYSLDGYNDIKIDETMLSTLVNNGNGLIASSIIAENCDDIAKYGFDEPVATVEFTYRSGNTVKFYVGDTSPSDSGEYVMVEGKKDVYLVQSSKLLNYSNSVNDFVDTTVLESTPDGIQQPVKSLRIERKDMDIDILIEYDVSSEDAYSGGTASAYKMIEPAENYLKAETSTGVISGMFGLIASKADVLHCTEDDIKNAGLDEPFCKVTAECGEDIYVLLLSEQFTDDNGKKCCYCMIDGGNIIYIINTDNTPWLTVQPVDIATSQLITSYVWNVTELTVSGGSENAKFVIAPIVKEEVSESPSASDFNVTLNGEKIVSESYRKFYQFLVSANAEEFALGVPVPDGKPSATIEYKDSYTGKTMKYEFYEDSVLKSLIVVNGESKYYCTSSFVKVMLDNVGRVKDNEELVTAW